MPQIIARPQTGLWTRLRIPALLLLGSAALAASAHVQVPFWPVPMTMQTCVVLALGAAMGPRLGVATVALYLAQGAVGLPVFATTAGLLGPTGGYLVGCLAAAACAGLAHQRVRGLFGRFAVLLGADALLFVFGIAWLSTFIGLSRAIAAGLVSFLLAELVKISLALAVTQTWRPRRA